MRPQTGSSSKIWATNRRSEKRKSQKKEDPGARKGRKVGSLKRRVRSQLARWEMKNCTPLWREAHFQVKMYKTLQLRSTFRSWAVEKVHAVVARSTFQKSKWYKTHQLRTTLGSWVVEKVHSVCRAKHISKSKCTKHTSSGPLLEVEMSKKCTPLWREAHFEVNMYKAHQVRTKLRCRKSARRGGAKHISKSKCTKHHMFAPVLEVQISFRVAGARDCAPSQKWAKREGFVAFQKTDGRRGTFEEDLQRCIFRGWRSTRDIFIRSVRRSERWFPERGCILEHQIFRFAEMILRDRCSTSYDLASLFRGRRSSLDRWTGKIAKRIGTRPTFHFWRKSRRILSFLMLPTSKNEEVLQNCFVFDVVTFKHWGSLGELLLF